MALNFPHHAGRVFRITRLQLSEEGTIKQVRLTVSGSICMQSCITIVWITRGLIMLLYRRTKVCGDELRSIIITYTTYGHWRLNLQLYHNNFIQNTGVWDNFPLLYINYIERSSGNNSYNFLYTLGTSIHYTHCFPWEYIAMITDIIFQWNVVHSVFS